MKATTKDLRHRAGELLSATDRGEEVIITYRGRKRAKLIRFTEDKAKQARVEQSPSFGMWKDREMDVDALVRHLRRGRELP